MTRTILHIAVLLALAITTICGIFSVPAEDAFCWAKTFYLCKAIGFAAGYAFYRLYNRWTKTDSRLAAYHNWLDKSLENEI